ncbi:MAG: hypothetical protein U0133_01345 [Gemmatimonadales bacterium]
MPVEVAPATNGGLYHNGPLYRAVKAKLSEDPQVRFREAPLEAAAGALHARRDRARSRERLRLPCRAKENTRPEKISGVFVFPGC